MLKRQKTYRKIADYLDFEREVVIEEERTKVKSGATSARAKSELQAVSTHLAESKSYINILKLERQILPIKKPVQKPIQSKV